MAFIIYIICLPIEHCFLRIKKWHRPMHDTYRLVVYIWCEYVNGSSLNKCCSPYFIQICVVFFFTCSSLHPPRPERENNTWEFHKTVWAPPFPHFIGRTLDYFRVIISYNKLHHFYCLDVLMKCHCRPTGFVFLQWEFDIAP